MRQQGQILQFHLDLVATSVLICVWIRRVAALEKLRALAAAVDQQRGSGELPADARGVEELKPSQLGAEGTAPDADAGSGRSRCCRGCRTCACATAVQPGQVGLQTSPPVERNLPPKAKQTNLSAGVYF